MNFDLTFCNTSTCVKVDKVMLNTEKGPALVLSHHSKFVGNGTLVYYEKDGIQCIVNQKGMWMFDENCLWFYCVA